MLITSLRAGLVLLQSRAIWSNCNERHNSVGVYNLIADISIFASREEMSASRK